MAGGAEVALDRDDISEEQQRNGELALVSALAFMLSTVAFVWFYRHGDILLWGDAVAHINIARRIVDARNPEYYTGASTAQGKRPGHIPGSTNLTFSTLLDSSGRFKSREVLASMFRDAGVKQGDRVVSYCHIGQQATVVYFVARYLGYDARLYDGSWEEWSAHADLQASLEGVKK